MEFIWNGERVSFSRYKMMLSLNGDEKRLSVLERHKDILNMDVTYRGHKIDAFVIDLSDEHPVVQLVIDENRPFNKDIARLGRQANCWKDSYIRNYINSDWFIGRFNREFAERIIATTVHTDRYETRDRFFLLSHEEVGFEDRYKQYKDNSHSRRFDAFDGTINSRVRTVNSTALYWWLRSADTEYRNIVGLVSNVGEVSYDYVGGYIGCLPVCTIG